MQAHHLEVVDRLIERFGQDPAFPALIVGGSIAKGYELADSDVDILLVATDPEYARRVPDGDFHYFTTDLCSYPGGYVDGKVVNLDFLREVAERGSEPARSAFAGAWCAYSRLPEVSSLVERIPVYPEDQHLARLTSFYSQFEAWRWYAGETKRHADRYLLLQSLRSVILFGGRMILAHNRILYPYHKWFMRVLRDAPAKPAGLMNCIDAALAEPSVETIEAFCQSVLGFTEWPRPAEGWPARFMNDSEWGWRRDAAAVDEW